MAKDFRLISLIHRFAKLVAKILANRLATFLDSLVATNQSAFIRGRFIYPTNSPSFSLLNQPKKMSPTEKPSIHPPRKVYAEK
jgi:hypothetical protein